jgi:hypothetical protein
MEKTIIINNEVYLVTDDQMIEIDEELVFEIKTDKIDSIYIIGLFDDLLGSPIKKVWKILKPRV